MLQEKSKSQAESIVEKDERSLLLQNEKEELLRLKDGLETELQTMKSALVTADPTAEQLKQGGQTSLDERKQHRNHHKQRNGRHNTDRHDETDSDESNTKSINLLTTKSVQQPLEVPVEMQVEEVTGVLSRLAFNEDSASSNRRVPQEAAKGDTSDSGSSSTSNTFRFTSDAASYFPTSEARVGNLEPRAPSSGADVPTAISLLTSATLNTAKAVHLPNAEDTTPTAETKLHEPKSGRPDFFTEELAAQRAEDLKKSKWATQPTKSACCPRPTSSKPTQILQSCIVDAKSKGGGQDLRQSRRARAAPLSKSPLSPKMDLTQKDIPLTGPSPLQLASTTATPSNPAPSAYSSFTSDLATGASSVDKGVPGKSFRVPTWFADVGAGALATPTPAAVMSSAPVTRVAPVPAAPAPAVSDPVVAFIAAASMSRAPVSAMSPAPAPPQSAATLTPPSAPSKNPTSSANSGSSGSTGIAKIGKGRRRGRGKREGVPVADWLTEKLAQDKAAATQTPTGDLTAATAAGIATPGPHHSSGPASLRVPVPKSEPKNELLESKGATNVSSTTSSKPAPKSQIKNELLQSKYPAENGSRKDSMATPKTTPTNELSESKRAMAANPAACSEPASKQKDKHRLSKSKWATNGNLTKDKITAPKPKFKHDLLQSKYATQE